MSAARMGCGLFAGMGMGLVLLVLIALLLVVAVVAYLLLGGLNIDVGFSP